VRSRAGQAWRTKHARARVVPCVRALRLAGAGPTQRASASVAYLQIWPRPTRNRGRSWEMGKLGDAASNAKSGGRCSAAEGVKMSVLCVPDETGKRVARYNDARIR
jgi:hypothetical protein